MNVKAKTWLTVGMAASLTISSMQAVAQVRDYTENN